MQALAAFFFGLSAGMAFGAVVMWLSLRPKKQKITVVRGDYPYNPAPTPFNHSNRYLN